MYLEESVIHAIREKIQKNHDDVLGHLVNNNKYVSPTKVVSILNKISKKNMKSVETKLLNILKENKQNIHIVSKLLMFCACTQILFKDEYVQLCKTIPIPREHILSFYSLQCIKNNKKIVDLLRKSDYDSFCSLNKIKDYMKNCYVFLICLYKSDVLTTDDTCHLCTHVIDSARTQFKQNSVFLDILVALVEHMPARIMGRYTEKITCIINCLRKHKSMNRYRFMLLNAFDESNMLRKETKRG